jgi:hypothetical protein
MCGKYVARASVDFNTEGSECTEGGARTGVNDSKRSGGRGKVGCRGNMGNGSRASTRALSILQGMVEFEVERRFLRGDWRGHFKS